MNTLREVDLIVIESWGLVSLKRLVETFDAECARVERLLDKHGLRAVSINAAFGAVFHAPLDDAGRQANRLRTRRLPRERLFSRLQTPVLLILFGHKSRLLII